MVHMSFYKSLQKKLLRATYQALRIVFPSILFIRVSLLIFIIHSLITFDMLHFLKLILSVLFFPVFIFFCLLSLSHFAQQLGIINSWNCVSLRNFYYNEFNLYYSTSISFTEADRKNIYTQSMPIKQPQTEIRQSHTSSFLIIFTSTKLYLATPGLIRSQMILMHSTKWTHRRRRNLSFSLQRMEYRVSDWLAGACELDIPVEQAQNWANMAQSAAHERVAAALKSRREAAAFCCLFSQRHHSAVWLAEEEKRDADRDREAAEEQRQQEHPRRRRRCGRATRRSHSCVYLHRRYIDK